MVVQSLGQRLVLVLVLTTSTGDLDRNGYEGFIGLSTVFQHVIRQNGS